MTDTRGKMSLRRIFRARSLGGSPSEHMEHMIPCKASYGPLYPGHTLGPTHNDLDQVNFQSNINPAQSDNNRVYFQSNINPSESRIGLWSGRNPAQYLNVAQFGYSQGLYVAQLAHINPTSIQVNHTSIWLNQGSDNDLDSIKHNPEITIWPWLDPSQF